MKFVLGSINGIVSLPTNNVQYRVRIPKLSLKEMYIKSLEMFPVQKVDECLVHPEGEGLLEKNGNYKELRKPDGTQANGTPVGYPFKININ